MIHYTPAAESPLSGMWPEGVSGELVDWHDRYFHIRVKLAGHTDLNPSTAMVVAPMERCRVA